MALSFDPATREALLTRVRFYRDLGLTEFYRRPVDPALLAQLEAASALPHQPEPDPSENAGAPSFPRSSAERVGEHESQSTSLPVPSSPEDPAICSI